MVCVVVGKLRNLHNLKIKAAQNGYSENCLAALCTDGPTIEWELTLELFCINTLEVTDAPCEMWACILMTLTDGP